MLQFYSVKIYDLIKYAPVLVAGTTVTREATSGQRQMPFKFRKPSRVGADAAEQTFDATGFN